MMDNQIHPQELQMSSTQAASDHQQQTVTQGPDEMDQLDPDQLPEDCDNGAAPVAKATELPLESMDEISGYKDIVNPNFSFVPPPPSYDQAVAAPTDTADSFNSALTISEEEARRCLLDFVNAQSCWGKGAAESMKIDQITDSTAVHYLLETFLESRASSWKSIGYHGEAIDGPENGPPPQPWEIQVPDPTLFTDALLKVEVPHTASVKPCHHCMSCTLITCITCLGFGRTKCNWCRGRGKRGMGDKKRDCIWCIRGKRICRMCQGSCRIPCPTCEATGNLKCFIELTIQYKTHGASYILERTNFPDHLIAGVQGETLFEDCKPMLHPIQAFPEKEINDQSEALIQQHRGFSQSGRIWSQRHVIRGVPVHQCDCMWKDKQLQFFVYGNDKKVYVPNYPQTSCWGCALL